MGESWVELSIDDVHNMLIALVGLDFGDQPEKRIPEIRESRKSMAAHAAEMCGIKKTDTILDLGSGCGFGTYWLAQYAGHVHACDISPSFIQFASNELNDIGNVSFHLLKKDYSLSDFADHSIDALVAISVFIHMNLYDFYLYFQSLIESSNQAEKSGSILPTRSFWIWTIRANMRIIF